MAKLGSAHGPGAREETSMIEATEEIFPDLVQRGTFNFLLEEVMQSINARVGTNLHRHLNVVGSHLQYRTRRTNYICL
ncbi:unnamed protein product [Musa acuminata subsp. burmannicoides]